MLHKALHIFGCENSLYPLQTSIFMRLSELGASLPSLE